METGNKSRARAYNGLEMGNKGGMGSGDGWILNTSLYILDTCPLPNELNS